MTDASGREAYSRAMLTYLAEPGDRVLAQLVRAVGAAAAVDGVRSGRLPAVPGADPAAARRSLARWRDRWEPRFSTVPAPDELLAFRDRGIRVIGPGDPEWPGQLADLGDEQPYALWVLGSADLRLSCSRSVAVTGSRAATAYGSYVASDLAGALAGNGYTVIAGGALGIDAAAHRAALGADGVTVAVLASGVDVLYPAALEGLLSAITAAKGALVSEWPPGFHVSRQRFRLRCRLVAALAGATLVVEAGERSAALGTARCARDLGRPLMAVPGPVTSGLSAGSHQVLRDWQGALVTGSGDVLEVLRRAPQPTSLSPGAAAGEGRAASGPDAGR